MKRQDRRFVPISEVIEYGRDRGIEGGVCACVDVENMGWCKDGVTRWYHFNMDGEPCYTLKR